MYSIYAIIVALGVHEILAQFNVPHQHLYYQHYPSINQPQPRNELPGSHHFTNFLPTAYSSSPVHSLPTLPSNYPLANPLNNKNSDILDKHRVYQNMFNFDNNRVNNLPTLPSNYPLANPFIDKNSDLLDKHRVYQSMIDFDDNRVNNLPTLPSNYPLANPLNNKNSDNLLVNHIGYQNMVNFDNSRVNNRLSSLNQFDSNGVNLFPSSIYTTSLVRNNQNGNYQISSLEDYSKGNYPIFNDNSPVSKVPYLQTANLNYMPCNVAARNLNNLANNNPQISSLTPFNLPLRSSFINTLPNSNYQQTYPLNFQTNSFNTMPSNIAPINPNINRNFNPVTPIPAKLPVTKNTLPIDDYFTKTQTICQNLPANIPGNLMPYTLRLV